MPGLQSPLRPGIRLQYEITSMRHDSFGQNRHGMLPDSRPDPRDMLRVIIITLGFGGLAMMLVLIEILSSAV